MVDYDVIVIGAGYTGLFAARQLARAGKRVLVLEARDRVGGRAESEFRARDLHLDFGARWIDPAHSRLLELAREYNKETGPAAAAGERLLLNFGRLRRYAPGSPALGQAGHWALRLRLRELDALSTSLKESLPHSAAGRARDLLPLSGLLSGPTLPRAAASVLHALCTDAFGASPANISQFAALRWLGAQGGASKYVERTLMSSATTCALVLAEGVDAPARAMANELGRGRVMLATPALSLQQREGHVVVLTARNEFSARRALVTVPLPLALRLQFEPELSGELDQSMQHAPSGAITSYVAIYSEPFWREAGLSGDAIATEGAVVRVNDATPPSGRPGVLLARATLGHSRTCATKEARIADITKALAGLFGAAALSPIEVLAREWHADRWTRGGLGPVYAPGSLSVRSAADFSTANILFTNADLAQHYPGTVEGALAAAESAVTYLLD